MALIEEYKEQEKLFRKSLKPVAIYSLLANLCMLAMPAFLFQVYDRVLIARSYETLIALLLIALVVLVSYGFFEAVRMALLAKAATKMENEMIGLVMAGELARQTDTNAQTIRDVSSLRQVLASPAFAALFDFPIAPIFFLIIFFIHPVLGGIVVFGGAGLVGVALWGSRKTDPITSAHMEALVAAHRSLDSHMSSQEIIRAQGMYREAVKDWGGHNGKQVNLFLQNFITMSSFSSVSKAARQLVQIFMIGGGALLVLNEAATAGVIFATSIIGARALQPVEQVIGGWRALRQGVETRKRLMKRLEDLSLPEDRTRLPRPKGNLALERVVYVPRPGTPPIIKGISGSIAAGDSVAIIGPSGAGKSTLARLIVGYYQPSGGLISLDGQDINAWDPVARGLHMGYVPQQVSFFEASIRENIARLRRDDPQEMAIEAAKVAGVHEMILKMPQGYDTIISKQGFYPSGGQAQLIALARAFYGHPSVLVLDEPNAALDSTGEQIFHNALKTANRRKMTVIIVTQRPSVLNFVNKVMMLQDGAVKKFGPKEEVMSSGLVQAVPKGKPAGPATKAAKAGAAPQAKAEKQPSATAATDEKTKQKGA